MWLTIFGSLIGIISFCGNLLVVMAVILIKRLKTPSNTLVAFLCCVDMLVSITVITSFVVGEFYPDVAKPVCNLVLGLQNAGWCLSCATVEAISLDRFLAIQCPLKYRKHATVQLALVVIGVLSSMLLGFGAVHFVVFLTTPGKCYRELYTKLTGVYVMTAFRMFVFCQMIILYGCMFRTAFHHLKNLEVAKNMAAGKSCIKDKHSIVHIIEMKALKTCSIVLGTYLLMWIPPLVYLNVIARVEETRRLTAYPVLGVVSRMCPAISSAVNPLVYALMREDIRKGIYKLVKNKPATYNQNSLT